SPCTGRDNRRLTRQALGRLGCWSCPSALRWEGIVAVAVLVADTAILSMDYEFGLLVARDLPRRVNGLLLRAVHGGCPLVASAFDSPSVLVGNDMLILTGHDGSPTVKVSKSQPSGRVVNFLLLQHNALLVQTTVRASQLTRMQP